MVNELDNGSAATAKTTEVNRLFNVVNNMAERRWTEKALRESEEKLRSVLALSPDAIVIAGLDGNISECSQAALGVFDFSSKKELVGKNALDLIAPKDRERAREDMSKAVEQGCVKNLEYACLNKDGCEFKAELSMCAVQDYLGKPASLVIVAEDVTERKWTEGLLRMSEERYSNLVETIPDVIYRVAEDGAIISLNSAAERLTGWERSELLGKPFFNIIHPDDLPRAAETFQRILRGEMHLLEMRVLTKSGEYRVGEFSGRPNLKNGKIVGVFGVARDVTERKRAEEALRASEKRLRELIENLPAGICVSTPEGEILEANPAVLKIFGHDSREELLKLHASALYCSPEDRLRLVELRKKGVLRNFEVCLKRKDGSTFRGSITSIAHTSEAGAMQFFTVVEDVTERRRMEDEAKRRLMKFKLEGGNLYLAEEPSPALALEAFRDMLKVGYSCAIISRTPQEEFRNRVEGSFEHLWLGEKAASASLKEIELRIESMPMRNAILLDSMDYLILKNGFRETLSFVQRLKELAYLTGQVIILCVGAKALSEAELRLLKKEAKQIEALCKAKLPEDMLDVLRFIYKQNSAGIKPSHTGVSRELGISLPTVRKRVRFLISTGYVIEAKNGRDKMIELTEQGKALF